MFEYLSMSIDDILQSEEIIINALGLLDKRVGKRRLRNVDIKALHPIAQAFYWVRCESENIKIT